MENIKRIILGTLIVLIIFFAYVLQKLGISNQQTSLPQVPNNTNNISPNNKQMMQMRTSYKDGVYTGNVSDAIYGYYQVRAIITNGRITDIQFLQFPNDRENSIFINSQSMPILKQEAITAQSANVDIVSGATDSSIAFRESLQSALSQAM